MVSPLLVSLGIWAEFLKFFGSDQINRDQLMELPQEVFQEQSYTLMQHVSTSDNVDRKLVNTLNAFLLEYERRSLTDDMAYGQLLRARAQIATNLYDPQAGVAWRQAVDALYPHLDSLAQVDLLNAAAQGAGLVRDEAMVDYFHSILRNHMADDGFPTEAIDIKLFMAKLSVGAPSRDWREIEDEITDFRAEMGGLPLWTAPRLQAVLEEMDLRLARQPVAHGKRERLSQLKAEATIAIKAQRSDPPKHLVQQYRRLGRNLADLFDI